MTLGEACEGVWRAGEGYPRGRVGVTAAGDGDTFAFRLDAARDWQIRSGFKIDFRADVV
jgi:hypothetical protein